MSVEVTFIGRLGNNLFQYALGRIVAEHHGLELNCLDSWGGPVQFMGKEVDLGPPATLPGLSPHFPAAPLSLAGRRITIPVESLELSSAPGWSGQIIDLRSLLENPKPRQIRLGGYFQRYEYFSPFAERIREWFRVRLAEPSMEIGPRDVLMNIRRGRDYEVRDWTLPMTYYHQTLSSLKAPGRVYVCGTCIDERVRGSLEKYDPIYFNGTPIEHLGFMTRFSRLILSNSTFAWWGAFLSDATEIYAPQSEDGRTFALTGFGDVNLHMQESRYREVPISGIATFALPVLDRARSVKRHVAEDSLLIDYADGRSLEIPVDPRNCEWINQLLEHRKAITLAEIRNNFTGTDLSMFIEQLVRHQIISQIPVYLE